MPLSRQQQGFCSSSSIGQAQSLRCSRSQCPHVVTLTCRLIQITVSVGVPRLPPQPVVPQTSFTTSDLAAAQRGSTHCPTASTPHPDASHTFTTSHTHIHPPSSHITRANSLILSSTYPHSPPLSLTLPTLPPPPRPQPTNPSSWYLTRLELGRHAAYSCSFALEQLTRLCRLTLYEDSADVLVPSVGCLSGLTRLALVDMSAGSISKLKALPPQLLELQLSLARLKKSEELPPGRGRGGEGIVAGVDNININEAGFAGLCGFCRGVQCYLKCPKKPHNQIPPSGSKHAQCQTHSLALKPQLCETLRSPC